MMRKKVLFVFSLIFLSFCMGCAGLGIRKGRALEEAVFLDPEDIIAVNPDLRFDDLPIPAGFLIDSKNSYTFQNEKTRAALLRYIGKDSPQKLVQFFVEQMPRYNWTTLNQVEFGKIVLNFEKAEETCVIIIEAQKRMKVFVTISISPK